MKPKQLGPAMRADIMLDCPADPGTTLPIVDRAYRDNEFNLLDVVFDDTPLRAAPPEWEIALPANPLVNRHATLTPFRRPIMTPLGQHG